MSASLREPAAGVQIGKAGDRQIRIERIFNAPREQVWRAFTDPKLVAQWWGRGNKLVIERLEVRPAGESAACAREDARLRTTPRALSTIEPLYGLPILGAVAHRGSHRVNVRYCTDGRYAGHHTASMNASTRWRVLQDRGNVVFPSRFHHR